MTKAGKFIYFFTTFSFVGWPWNFWLVFIGATYANGWNRGNARLRNLL